MALLNLVYHDQLFPRAAYRRSYEARSKPLISAPPVAAPSACWRCRTSAPVRQPWPSTWRSYSTVVRIRYAKECPNKEGRVDSTLAPDYNLSDWPGRGPFGCRPGVTLPADSQVDVQIAIVDEQTRAERANAGGSALRARRVASGSRLISTAVSGLAVAA